MELEAVRLCRQWSSSAAAAAQVLEASPTKDRLRTSGLATRWHTSLKESQDSMSGMKMTQA